MLISGGRKTPHFGLLPSAGMGHLAPFSRLAATLSSRGCDVSFVTAEPTVSLSESLHTSQLLSSFPNIQSLLLPLVELDHPDADPFFLRFEALRLSADHLPPLLVGSGISALVIDVSLASTYIPVANRMNLPCYILFTSSAAMFSLFAFFPTCGGYGDIDIPGLWTIREASVPPPLRDPSHLFTTQFVANGQALPDAHGILVNTFDALEPEALAALNGGRVTPGLPPAIAVGPLLPFRASSGSALPAWLDRQPQRSVVYVSFGNRTAMKSRQIKELAIGLERSQCRFLWVLKTKIVDREEEDRDRLEQVVGEGYLERVKERGLVVNGWVEQEEALANPAVGGFVSHCGWNSVTEAAMAGVRMLGWPRNGDQRVNGEVVRRSGLGVWMEEWSWEAEGEVVTGEEIGKKVREMMEDEELRRSAARVGEEANKAVSAGGSSDKRMEEFIGKLLV